MEQKQKYIELLQNILKDDNSQKENINIFLTEFWDDDVKMNMGLISLLSGIASTLDYSLFDEEDIKDKRLLDKSYIKELVKEFIEELKKLE